MPACAQPRWSHPRSAAAARAARPAAACAIPRAPRPRVSPAWHRQHFLPAVPKHTRVSKHTSCLCIMHQSMPGGGMPQAPGHAHCGRDITCGRAHMSGRQCQAACPPGRALLGSVDKTLPGRKGVPARMLRHRVSPIQQRRRSIPAKAAPVPSTSKRGIL